MVGAADNSCVDVRAGDNVAVCRCRVNFTDTADPGDDIDVELFLQNYVRHGPRGNRTDCFPGTGPPPAGRCPDAIFHLVGIVGMRGTGDVAHIAVIFRAMILVGHLQGDGCTQSFAIFGAGQDDDLIGFLAVCRYSALARPPAIELRLDVFFRE